MSFHVNICLGDRGMNSSLQSAALLFQSAMQRITLVLVLSLGLGLAGYSIACAAGYAPWLMLPLNFGEVTFADAGQYVQVGVSALALGLLFFLPTNARVMALETSHRSFHIGMKDVARAYAAAHRADREGVFTLSSEFDSVRERIAFLRDHPDLAELEPSVLEVAAQMSHISRELGQVYSDSRVQRARDFLTARQQEIEDFNARIEEAKLIATDIRKWHMRVELEEDIAEAQIARLCEDLEDILPEIVPEEHRLPEEAEEWAESFDPLAEAGSEIDDLPASETQQDDRIVAMLSRRAAE